MTQQFHGRNAPAMLHHGVDLNKHSCDNCRMNWKTILYEIQACGLSQTQVAERIEKSQAWVSAVSQGKYSDLRWSDGEAMLNLLEELRSQSKEAA